MAINASVVTAPDRYKITLTTSDNEVVVIDSKDTTFTIPPLPIGRKGEDGKSAYQIALDNGFIGSETEWLASLKGEKGDNGTTFTHTQIQASTEWIVVHNLNKKPSVTIVDSSGSIIYSDVAYDSLNQVTIKFNVAMSGEVYFN
jgi:hypothetical protein